MEDLTQKISAMLNDPTTMAQVQSIIGALGGNSDSKSQAAPAPAAPPAPKQQPAVSNHPLSTLAGLGSSGLNAETLGMIAKIAPMLAAVQQEDDSTRLLHALRPLLSEPRQKKLDEAIRLMQLMRALPMLRQSGLLG